MIPVDQISPGNYYSQDDACFLLGDGFSKRAAKETICAACRSGELQCRKHIKRYWFTGKAFLE